MPRQRQVERLEKLCCNVVVSYCHNLCTVSNDVPRADERALFFCAHLAASLPATLLNCLGDQLVLKSSGGRWGLFTPLHAVAGYMLGAHTARFSVRDTELLSAVLMKQRANIVAPPNGGPRKLFIATQRLLRGWRSHSDQRADGESSQTSFSDALDQVLRLFSQLTDVSLSLCATNSVLRSVGAQCRHLVRLSVDVAAVNDSGVCQLLGLGSDDVIDHLQLIRHGQRVSPRQQSHLSALREVRLESTLVTERGVAVLLAVLPQLYSCRVTDVDISDALDTLVTSSDGHESRGVASANWPRLQLRRVECRKPISDEQAERVARCCRRVRRLCVRGRRSQRNDTALLRWFTSLSELVSVELIDIHPESLVETFLAQIGSNLVSLRLVETFTIGDAHRLSLERLSAVISVCPQLQALALSLAVDPVSLLGSDGPGAPSIPCTVERVCLEGVWGPSVLEWLTMRVPLCVSLRLSGHAGGLGDGEGVQALIGRPLTQLRRLEMSCCRLSVPAVGALIDACPNLEYIGHLPYPAIDWLKQKALEHNWSLEIT